MLAFEPFRVEKRSAVLSPLPKRNGGAQAMSLHPFRSEAEVPKRCPSTLLPIHQICVWLPSRLMLVA